MKQETADLKVCSYLKVLHFFIVENEGGHMGMQLRHLLVVS